MKVILVNGSPNKNGCTNRALQEVEAQLNKEGIETEIFWIGANVQGCTACASCRKTGECIFKDKVNEFVEKAKEADGFVFGSAIYFASTAGSISSFMDRVFFSSRSSFADKPAASVVSCRRAGATEGFTRLNMYYGISNMPVVSSQYWNQVHGNTPEEVEQDIEGLQTMRTIGVNMAWLLKCIEMGKKNGVELPVREKPVMTNFIR